MFTVNHTKFGHGEIIGKEVKGDNIYFTIKFDDGKVSRFLLESFENGQLTAEGNLKDEIDCAISEKHDRELEKKNIASTLRKAVAAAMSVRSPRTRTRVIRPVAATVGGPTEAAYECYLIKSGYRIWSDSGKPSTVPRYVHGVNTVLEEEGISWTVLQREIDNIIDLYDVGGRKYHIGSRSNRTVINALKRFREFVNP